MSEQPMRSGFVALVGRPNVGKSTLVNRLVGQKVAIMSDKPQTTRHRIMAVLHGQGFQIVFLDTPGIHKPKHKLGEWMVKVAETTLSEVDVVCFVVSAADPRPGPGDRHVADRLARASAPKILVLNKVDTVAAEDLPARRSVYQELGSFQEVVPVSALTGAGIEALIGVLRGMLPEGPAYFPEDMVTDQPEQQLAAELIREQVLKHTREEVPHAVAVVVTAMERRENGLVYLAAEVLVERESQKGIVIGKHGSMLKQLGQAARQEIEALLGTSIYLDLRVKVKQDWRERQSALTQLGFHAE